MISQRLLQITLAVSIFVHGLIILPKANFNPFTPAPKAQTLTVRYIEKNSASKVSPRNSSDLIRQRLKSEPFWEIDAKIGTDNRNRTPPPYVARADVSGGLNHSPDRLKDSILAADSQDHNSLKFSKPAFLNSDVMAIKKKISLPPIEIAKIDNPGYISYYQIVREKIRRSAYQNHTRNETGEVYASFIISNDGYLKGARLVEEKTNAGDYLKNIALRSIKDASPFPNFPKELDYPQLSFNIIISFEIE